MLDLADFKVQMRAGADAGGTDKGNGLSGLDFLTGFDQQL